MAILNYTTSIDSNKTIAEIQRCLVKHGATKITTDFDGAGLPTAVTFCLTMNERMVGFSLPANYGGVLRAMKNDRDVPRRLCNPEQALRVSWRIVKDWVEAQMAIVDAELAKMDEVFLPYLILKNGDTLFKAFENKDFSQKLLG